MVRRFAIIRRRHNHTSGAVGGLPRPAWELYNVQADPDELHNLADDARCRADFKRMQDKVRAFMERTNDPWMTKWTYE